MLSQNQYSLYAVVVNKHGTERISPEREKTPTPDSSTNADAAGEHPDDFALVARGGGGDTIGVGMPVDLPEPETQPMDIDTVPNAGTSNETGTAIHKHNQTSGVATSGVAGENSDENAGGNGDDVARRSEHVVKPAPTVANSDKNSSRNDDGVAMRSEHVVEPAPAVTNSDENAGRNGDDVMRAPAVVKAPANKMPIRYLNGKRVSEYEWNRSENIKANDKLLQALELKNARGRIFGERDGKKGKENKDNRGERSVKRKKIPLANVGVQTLRSTGKAVTNRCVVHMVVDRCFVADSSAVCQRRQLGHKRTRRCKS